MNVLLLYSWEDGNEDASNWAAALCFELSKYKNIDPTFDLLWKPESNVLETIREKIENAQKIIVIVTKSYNQKIRERVGTVSYEEVIYKEIIEKSAEKNKILFVLKEKGIDLPDGWEGYNRFDLSEANFFAQESNYKANFRNIYETINQIVLCLIDKPIFSAQKVDKRKIPQQKRSSGFKQLYKQNETRNHRPDDQALSPSEQKKRLIKFITDNANQESFIMNYIKSGLSSDNNLNGRMTSLLFYEYFYIPRDDNEERKFRGIVKNLFSDTQHNMLCFQSDGGSGKSVFLRTLTANFNNSETYSYSFFDFSDIYDKSVNKEDMIFNRFRKTYRSIMKDSAWRAVYINQLRRLNDIQLPDSDLMFNLISFIGELKNGIKMLIPDKLDDWYTGYSKRAHAVKESADVNILFYILMVFYLIALGCKPQHRKQEKFIFIFDNIETFDNGNMARNIADYVQHVHSFLNKIFIEMNDQDTFFLKFTFVLSMRTSTYLPFGNIHTDLWNGGRNVIRLPFHDFTIDALNKKLLFLKVITNYEETLLFKSLYRIILFVLPKHVIDKVLDNNEKVDYREYRHFTKYRFLPFFNNNYRTSMQTLYTITTNAEMRDTYSTMLDETNKKSDKEYDYSINGLRLMIFRDIFNVLQENDYLSAIGFNQLCGSDEHSKTRMVLEFLYWSEVKYYIDYPNTPYEGESLIQLLNVFNHFMSIEQIASILYDTSVYIKRNRVKAAALYAWGYLVSYNNLDADFSEEEFKRTISQISKTNEMIITQNNERIMPEKIKVRLSDAGMCFVENYLRNPEFLMARHTSNGKQNALFSLDKIDNITEYVNTTYDTILNCINKIITGGEKVCVLYNPGKTTLCFYKSISKPWDILQCALFIRCQECIDMVREAIDYFDRFRIIQCIKQYDKEINNFLLDAVLKFYQLYDKINEEICTENCNTAIMSILKMWDGQLDNKIWSRFNQQKNIRVQRFRRIRHYYVFKEEKMKQAIQDLKQSNEIIDVYSYLSKAVPNRSP